MGRPDEAEEMLARCPSLKDFTDETFLNTGNPRFSGDMVLLSRIRLAQGRPTDALRLASKALAFRRKLLGNRLKTCDYRLPLIVPYDSPIFISVQNGDIPGMRELLGQSQASIDVVDPYGLGLLYTVPLQKGHLQD
ncbi:hypothetical protein IL306_010649 [Fusarium sp. DS 682]|nr:hypothetical protein IL306_010649 [Fusarium sp. DS 682]